jgi:DNA mismatch repair protein MutL
VTVEVVAEDDCRIRVLPPELAEQIAAGEVVERPASVVKELVENALDAGARKIEVTLEAGGRRLLRVVDDGSGMSPTEVRLAVQRHATSKLRSADDLWSLGTFGFRGEALPSIGSVSRLSIGTKRPGTEAGFRLVIEGGRQTEAREVGMADGTQIEVRDLFYNVPARLKFLKTEATEAANVSEALLRLALANPQVHVKLRSGDRTVLDLPPVAAFAERVRSALGRRGAGALHEAQGEENGVRVHAFVGPPDEASSTPRNTFLFVARRGVRDRALVSALVMAYGELLERGRYPLGALFVEVPGAEVDVNVHPQKLEVRFARAQEVYAAVRHVVGAAIAQAPWLAAPARSYSLPVGIRAGAGIARDGGDPGPHRDSGAGDVESPAWSMGDAGARAARGAGGARDGRDNVDRAGLFPAPARAGESTGTEAGTGMTTGTGVTFFGGLRYVGQVHRTYLVCEAPGELVLVDQHAAHERVAYARLRRAHAARAVPRQALLYPIEVQVDAQAQALAESPEGLALLDRLGFEVDGFGKAGGVPQLVVRAVPQLLAGADVRALLVDALGSLGDEPALTAAEAKVDHVLATMACHAVRRAGDVLPREEVEALLASLDEVDLASHCPHGRPVLVRLSLSEIERRFGRV